MIHKISQLYTVTIVVVLVVAGLILGIADNATGPQISHTAYATSSERQVSVNDRQEILWLARVVYSETKRAQEQVLVAWIVRNRVESKHFADSYKRVALSTGQFSGLNAFDKQYHHNISRDYKSGGEEWKTALDVARAVYYADGTLRPFSTDVRHFYSPKSVKSTPAWAEDKDPVYVIQDPESSHARFAFFAGVK